MSFNDTDWGIGTFLLSNITKKRERHCLQRRKRQIYTMRSISAIITFILLQVLSLGDAFVAPRSMNRPSMHLRDSEIPPDVDVQDQERHVLMGFDEEFVHFPHRDFSAFDVVSMCMDGLKQNGVPYANAGLEVCWNFSGDRCRASEGGNLQSFIDHSANPVFGSMVNAREWKVKSKGSIIPGTLTRGAMQTVLVEVTTVQGSKREFLWTMQQERRPPRQECWLVHECIAKDKAYDLTM